MPHGIHEWAKSDRLALAYGFFDNGMDFFHPHTLSLRPIDGITGVEFPLQAYLVAIAGKIFGREYISFFFHLLNILVGSVGITFLFKWVFEETKNTAFAILGILPVLSSTFFLDYMGNYLPDPFAASLVFISFYYSYSWLQLNKNYLLATSITILTLATLIKTTAIVYLAAFWIIAFFVTVNKRKSLIRIISYGGIGIVFILGWQLYSRWLNTTYESDLFLARIFPIDNIEDLKFLLFDRIPNLWLKEFFTCPTYFLIVIVIAGSPFLIKDNLLKWWLFLTATFTIVLLGLFSGQLIDHDYYFIILGLAFIVLLYCLCIIKIGKKSSLPHIPLTLLTVIIAIALLFQSHQRLIERRSPNYAGFSEYYKYKWMIGGEKILNKLSIPKDENILVLDEYAPNLGLMYFGRKGINYPYSKWKTDIGVITDILDKRKWRIVVIKSLTICDDENITSMVALHFETLYEDENKIILKYRETN